MRLELDNFQRAYFDLFSKSAIEFNSRFEDGRKTILEIGENMVVVPEGSNVPEGSEEDAEMAVAELEKLDDITKPAIDDLAWLFLNMFRVFYSMIDAYLFRFLSYGHRRYMISVCSNNCILWLFEDSRYADTYIRNSELLGYRGSN